MRQQSQAGNLKNRWCNSAPARFLILLAAMMFLVGQSVASSAPNDMGWIEICGDAGIELMQQDSDTPHERCLECDCCLVQASAFSGDFPHDYLAIGRFDFTSVSFGSSQSVIVYHAEQFWAANRGPPLINEKINKMVLLSNEMNKSGIVASNTRSFPWV
ncbi:MAG: hypothetical protein JKY31_09835 [Rhodobacteraceae bacterium]|nr:hypothetical protein [Paracoccaceae bacterium]